MMLPLCTQSPQWVSWSSSFKLLMTSYRRWLRNDINKWDHETMYLGFGWFQKCFGLFSLSLFLSLHFSLSQNYVIRNGKIVGNQNFGIYKFPWRNIWARISTVFIFLIPWCPFHQIKVGLPFTTILVEFFLIAISTSDEMIKISLSWEHSLD